MLWDWSKNKQGARLPSTDGGFWYQMSLFGELIIIHFRSTSRREPMPHACQITDTDYWLHNILSMFWQQIPALLKKPTQAWQLVWAGLSWSWAGASCSTILEPAHDQLKPAQTSCRASNIPNQQRMLAFSTGCFFEICTNQQMSPCLFSSNNSRWILRMW